MIAFTITILVFTLGVIVGAEIEISGAERLLTEIEAELLMEIEAERLMEIEAERLMEIEAERLMGISWQHSWQRMAFEAGALIV